MKITISSEPRLLHILRGVVRWRAEESGFLSSDVESLALAIDEAVSNVIRHTYLSRPDGKVSLEIRTFSDRLEFVLEDSGPKVKREDIRPRSLDEVRPGGLGTLFINCFIDESFYEGERVEGNRLRMVKYLPGRVASCDEGTGQERG